MIYLRTEYLTLFWFAMLLNEDKPQFQKSSSDGKFEQYIVADIRLCKIIRHQFGFLSMMLELFHDLFINATFRAIEMRRR